MSKKQKKRDHFPDMFLTQAFQEASNNVPRSPMCTLSPPCASPIHYPSSPHSDVILSHSEIIPSCSDAGPSGSAPQASISISENYNDRIKDIEHELKIMRSEYVKMIHLNERLFTENKEFKERFLPYYQQINRLDQMILLAATASNEENLFKFSKWYAKRKEAEDLVGEHMVTKFADMKKKRHSNRHYHEYLASDNFLKEIKEYSTITIKEAKKKEYLKKSSDNDPYERGPKSQKRNRDDGPGGPGSSSGMTSKKNFH
jgi:hypothetical protein